MAFRQMFTRLVGSVIKSKKFEKAYRRSLYDGPGIGEEYSHLERGIGWLEKHFIPQSMQYTIDCLPTIRRLLLKFPRERALEYLDFGAGSGSGAQLIATLHRSAFIWCRLKVAAMDINPARADYARHVFNDIDYIVGDLFEYDRDRSWDLVFCSHVIEHIDDPRPLIEELQRRARHRVIVYAPFEENPLGHGHFFSITREFLKSFDAESIEVVTSLAWGDPLDADARCVIAGLPGKA